MFKPGCDIFRLHKPFQEYKSKAISESSLSTLKVAYHTEGNEDVIPVFLDVGEETKNWHWLNYIEQGFPGGAVVGNLPADAGDAGSSPGPGGSHVPRSG